MENFAEQFSEKEWMSECNSDDICDERDFDFKNDIYEFSTNTYNPLQKEKLSMTPSPSKSRRIF
jgi:hypothetical protein